MRRGDLRRCAAAPRRAVARSPARPASPRSLSRSALRLGRGMIICTTQRQPVLGEEHVLGAAQADALGAERARLLGVARDVGVGAHLEPADLVGPAHEACRTRRSPRRRCVGAAPSVDLAGRAVERDPVALLAPTVPSDRQQRLARPRDRRAGARRRSGLPMPRATTAACEVMPPVAVRMPWAASMPWMSSGVVSLRTRMTFSPVAAPLGGVVGGRRPPCPTAAPGEAARPCGERGRASASGRGAGAAAGRARSGSTRSSASSRRDQPLVHHLDRDPHRGLRRCACRCASAACRACPPGW